MLRTQQSMVQVSPAAIDHWRTMGFEPLAGGKDVTAFAIFEDGGPDLTQLVSTWFKNVGETYEVS